jgi:hypothetical protein
MHVCEGNLITYQSLKSVRTDASLNCLKLFDIDGCPDTRLGRPDENLGFDFFELESAQNLP